MSSVACANIKMPSSKIKQLSSSAKRKKSAIMNDKKNKMRGAMKKFVLKRSTINSKFSD